MPHSGGMFCMTHDRTAVICMDQDLPIVVCKGHGLCVLCEVGTKPVLLPGV